MTGEVGLLQLTFLASLGQSPLGKLVHLICWIRSTRMIFRSLSQAWKVFRVLLVLFWVSLARLAHSVEAW